MAAKNTKLNEPNEKEYNIEKPPLDALLSGEIVLASANVMRYNNMSARSCGTVGMLVLTNFKIAFLCSHNTEFTKVNASVGGSLEKLLSTESNNVDDIIPISVIHQVCAISTVKQKQKRVEHGATKEISSHYDLIEIETKDFRIIKYDFKFAKENEKRSCFQAICHHIFPTSITNLFAFDYAKHIPRSTTDVSGRAFCSFSCEKDYEMNLSRLRSLEHWRVSTVNKSYNLSHSLPEHLVTPVGFNDQSVQSIASMYCDNRLPIWLWSDPFTGVSLLLSADLRNKNGSFSHPIKLLEQISDCQSKESSGLTTSIDVTDGCPSLKELKRSYNRLRKACVVHSIKEYWSTDVLWLSHVQDSKWLQYVAQCLDLSTKVTKIIKERATSVIVHDSDGRNFSILITSLVQIFLDPYYRTHLGLQALIQKDWVMKGFPFLKRLGALQHSKTKEKEDVYDGESPVFVLFLDCVHQLIKQYPYKFEYSEQFLILLADCAYSSLFSTFLFNSHRQYGELTTNLKLVSAWDFIAENIPLVKFNSVLGNPAYKFEDQESFDEQLDKRSVSSASSSCDSPPAAYDLLQPSTRISELHLWYSFYFRWLPVTDLDKGCSTEVMLRLQQNQLIEEVRYLKERCLQLQHKSSIDVSHGRSGSTLSTDSNSSINRRRTKHKRNPSKFSQNEEEKDSFLNVMSSFHFLKLIC